MSSADDDDSLALVANNYNNVRYYKMLLENNYITDLSNAQQANNFLQMEHSYSRDWRPMEGAHVMTTRTIMVHRPPPCPSCHVHSHDDLGIDMGDTYNPPIPSYNEESAKNSMDECERMAVSYRNLSLPTSSGGGGVSAAAVAAGSSPITDDQDWEETVNKFGWSKQQDTIFMGVAHILDLDHLARLANKERQHEPVLRRGVIDKSVARMRKLFAKFAWDTKLTQWLHNLLMDQLSPSYLASYLDILQTMKSKIPDLVDKMMSTGRSAVGGGLTNTTIATLPSTNSTAVTQDLLSSIMKKPWEPNVVQKNRKLPGQAVIVIVPTSPMMESNQSPRMQRWYNLFKSMGHVVPVKMNLTSAVLVKQSFQTVTEHMIAISRAKIQEVRNEQPTRQIILVGFNVGAALAIQIAIVEPVNSVVCMGFAYNTVNGVRGAPDDRILSLITPVLFVLGQNAARSSQEEIESLREKMQAQTSLVVVGSADDVLRVGKTKRQIEGVTQTMVDNMIMDEISEFATTCILNPPAPRDLAAENTPVSKLVNGPAAGSGGRGASSGGTAGSGDVAANRTGGGGSGSNKKRKFSQNGLDTDVNAPPTKTKATKSTGGGQDGKPVVPRKGRPRLTQPSAKKDAAAAAAVAPSVAAPAATMGTISLTPITPTAVPTPGKLSLIQPTGDVLNAAIQSILTTSSLSDTKTITTPSATLQEEIISSYEVLPNMDLKPLTTTTTTTKSPLTIQTTNKQQPPLSIRQTKTKTTQQNQHFVKLKPPGIGTNKMFPIKSPAIITPHQQQQRSSPSTTVLGVDNKAFTIKSTPTGTQLLSTTATTPLSTKSSSSLKITSKSKIMSPMINISPPKFTVYKSPAVQQQQQQQQQQIKRVSQILKLSGNSAQKSSSDLLSSTNIFDMPIVFADNDGNIHENSGNSSSLATLSSPLTSSSSSSIVTSMPISSTSSSAAAAPQTTMINSNTPVILSSVPSVSVIGSGISGTNIGHQGFQIQSIQTTTTGTRLPNRNIIINAIGPNKTATIGSVSGGGNNKVLLINRGPMKGQQVQLTGVSNILSNLQTVSTTIGSGNTIVTPGGGTAIVVSSSSSSSSSSISTTSSNPNVIPTLVKYTKVNVSNANTIRTVSSIGGNIEFRATGSITTTSSSAAATTTMTNSPTTFKSFPLGSKVEIFNNTIIKTTSSSSIAASSTNTKTITTTGGFSNKFPQTIMMNIDPKNMVKVSSPGGVGVSGVGVSGVGGGITDVKLKPTNTILIKPGGLRQIPIMNQGILNRNVTLRKLVNVNLVGQSKLVSGTVGGGGTTIITSSGQIKVTPTTVTTKSTILPQQLLSGGGGGISSSSIGGAGGTVGGTVTTQAGAGVVIIKKNSDN